MGDSIEYPLNYSIAPPITTAFPGNEVAPIIILGPIL